MGRVKDRLFTDTPAENFYENQDLLGVDPDYEKFLDALDESRMAEIMAEKDDNQEDEKMSLTASNNDSGDFELPPEGNALAICYQVVDLGLQKSVWNGKESMKHKLRIAWELPNLKMEDGKPFMVSGMYTVSLADKAKLRKHLEAWRGRKFTDEELQGFNVGNICGKPCMVQIVHNQSGDKTYANVEAVTGVPDEMKGNIPPLTNDQVVYDTEEGASATYQAFPEWLQNKINLGETATAASEAEQLASAGQPDDDFDDDIPF